jgi:glyoxylase-like metal-dependent hydrolase (beta-lactamase superfamily II)
MEAMRVTQVHDRIHRIETPFAGGGTVFLYLIQGDALALVDTGTTQSPSEVLEPALAELGLSLSNVDMILNTHIHLDHSGGNLAIKRASNAKIYVHSGDLDMAKSTEALVEAMISPLRVLEFSEEVITKRAEQIRKEAGEPAGADVVMNTGDIVDLGKGIRLEVVPCPGHTPGCIGYRWESEGVLLIGDSIPCLGSRMGGYPLYLDAVTYRQSLASAAEWDFDLLCMGHAYYGGLVNNPTRNRPEGQRYIREAAQVADTIQRAVEKAASRKPGASRREIALESLSDLIYQIPQRLVKETGFPTAGGPTLAAHVDAALSHSYPWGL